MASELADLPRKIIHIDMDAFFASVEQRDFAELRGQPVAVGGQGARGVVAAASYEARRFGVRSAMASSEARRRCPDLIFVPPRFDVYKSVSRQIRAIFEEHSALIEPLSLDEAYLDVTENRQGIDSATEIAEAIRARIFAETALTASAGVSYNKFLAKLASDQNKPNGICVIRPSQGLAFVEGLPVSRFHGVGPVTARRMDALEIRTGADLRGRSLAFLQQHFGRAGEYYYNAARAIDHRPVRANRERKSIGSETTFATDLTSAEACMEAMVPLMDSVCGHCERTGLAGRTVTIKLRYADFRQCTRSRTLDHGVSAPDQVRAVVASLLDALVPLEQGVRLLGVTLSTLEPAGFAGPQQLGLGL